MDKSLFYKMALKGGAYQRKEWVLAAFSVTRRPVAKAAPVKTANPLMNALNGIDDAATPTLTSSDLLYDIRYNRESTEVFVPISESENGWVSITDHTPMTALFVAGQALTVNPDDAINCTASVESTYGDLLFNYIALIHPFEARIPYQVGPVKIRKIEAMIAERLCDNVEIAGVEPQPHQIPVWMYMKFGRCMGALAGYTQLFVPTLTPKSLSTNAAIMKRRGELLEEHKDRLHDPVVVSRIQDELIQMDKDSLKGDPSEGFFISNKTWGTARKRMFVIHGPEAGFNEGGNAELVVNSLNEGWDTTKLPAMFNSTRAGSFYRGALTALGGEAVKFFMRVFQNTQISGDDCGSTLGLQRFIDPDRLDYYEGLWEMSSSGLIQLDKERLKAVAGKTILTRSPNYCKTGHTDYCAKCAGGRLAANPYRIGAENTAVASTFMNIMMASAHAKELKTAPLDFRTAFS
jgi:hypothetical protein